MGRSKQRSRMRGAIVAVFALAVVSIVGVSEPALAVDYSSQEITLVNLVNDYRVSLGLTPLMVSDRASDAAEKHSADMGTYDFFSHSTAQSSFGFPVGANAATRMAMCGYSYQVAWGETIAAGQTMAQTVFDAWRNSPAHDSVMKGSAFRVVGVGMVYVAGSRYGYYWTLDFGGYVDSTAHWVGASSTTSTTAPPTTSTTSTTSPPSTTTSTTAPPAATTTTSPPSTTSTTIMGSEFPDVPPNHVFYPEITGLASAGIVSGCADGLFHPEDLVTRAQFAKMIVLAMGLHTEPIENAGSPSFSDVPFAGLAYPFDYVEEAVASGIIQGYPDGTFRPLANVTRVQIALMLTRAGGAWLDIPPLSYPCPFVDVPAYAREAVRIAAYNGIIDGKSATVFDPAGWANRGQVAKMLDRFREAAGF